MLIKYIHACMHQSHFFPNNELDRWVYTSYVSLCDVVAPWTAIINYKISILYHGYKIYIKLAFSSCSSDFDEVDIWCVMWSSSSVKASMSSNMVYSISESSDSWAL